MTTSYLRLSLCLRERLTDLESAVSMAFSLSELVLPMDCLGVCSWMWLMELLDLADFYSASAWRFSSCSFFMSYYSLRRNYSSFLRKAYIRSLSCASACNFFWEADSLSFSSISLAFLLRSCSIYLSNSSIRSLSCSTRLAFSRSSSSLCRRRYSSFICSAFSDTTLLNSSSICLNFFSS